jgi:hypothetical protein
MKFPALVHGPGQFPDRFAVSPSPCSPVLPRHSYLRTSAAPDILGNCVLRYPTSYIPVVVSSRGTRTSLYIGRSGLLSSRGTRTSLYIALGMTGSC